MATLPIPPAFDKLDSKQVRAYLESIRSIVSATETSWGPIANDTTTITPPTAGATLTVSGGVGITVSGSSTTLTITGTDASTTSKGIASFNSSDFSVASGAVSIVDAGIDHNSLTNYSTNEHIDWTSTTSAFSTSGTAATGALTVTGNITVSGTVDGRDVATDGTKLDGIEASADVTDEANVTAALDGATLTAVTVASGDKVLLQDVSDSNNLKTATAQSIADLVSVPAEDIEDTVGAMVTGNTETGISVTYQDVDGTLDFVVSDTTVAGDTGSTGITPGDTLTIAGGTNATTAMSGDTLTVNVDDAFLRNTGDVGTGVYDFGGATSLEIPNGAAPTVNAAGEIAVDTTITDHTGLIKYHDGTEELTVIALPTANLTTTDGDVVAYNATNNEFEMTAGSGGSGFNQVVTQVFTSSGTYTPTSGMDYCIVELVGAGGGGGGCAATGTTSIAAAGGGGAGGYARETFTAATIGASQTVTIGAAGAGGAAGANNGTAGGNSTLGALLTANGGGGGTGSSTITTAATRGGGTAGTASGGDVNINGGAGGAGVGVYTSSTVFFVRGGAGGSNPLGPGAGVFIMANLSGSANAGDNGKGYGGGGGGAANTRSAAARAGGSGTAGICIITEFIS